MMFSCFDTIPACDGRTDGQTSCDSIVRAMHKHRAVKIKALSAYRTMYMHKGPFIATQINSSAKCL